MIKDIRFNGHTAEPSDYESPDGDLAVALNLARESSGLEPVAPPDVVLNVDSTLLITHKVEDHRNLIFKSGDKLWWIPEPEANTISDSDKKWISKNFGEIHDVNVVGNTIIVVADTVYYLLWKDGSYRFLGEKPPFVGIEFGCYIEHEGYVRGAISKAVSLDVKSYNYGAWQIDFDSQNTTDAVYGILLDRISEGVRTGCFAMPFFVRYALRLFDGSYCMHSAPVLMLPTALPPIVDVVGVNEHTSGDKVYYESHALRFRYNLFCLEYAILDIHNLPSDWADIVASIDIFVTAPIYTFDQSAKISGTSNRKDDLLNGYFREGIDADNMGADDEVFVGHFSGGSNLYETDYEDGYRDKFLKIGNGGTTTLKIPPNKNFYDQIKTCNGGNFYKIASIPVSSLSIYDNATDFKPLTIDSPDMTNLVTRPTLPDDFRSHHTVCPKISYVYNNRLCLSDISIKPPTPFSLHSSVESVTTTPSSLMCDGRREDIELEVYTRVNGVICKRVSDVLDWNDWDIEHYFPRFIYYPDSSAYKLNIKYNGQDHFIDLVAHDFLNGAYYFSNRMNSMPPSFSPAETRVASEVANLDNRVYLSETGNPFVFPVTNMVTVGNGRVLGLASACVALSEGQFGHFPIYAFTTDGVWSMEISSTGTIQSRQPVSRDVCINPKSITQLDRSVLFATDRGIMHISGSQVQCITDVINTETPFNVLNLPGMDKLHSMLGHDADSCLPMVPVSQFLSNCEMIFDYVNQRVIVYNSNFTYAYVYHLATQTWSMLYSKIKYRVPSYPQAFAGCVDNEGNEYIVDFSRIPSSLPLPALFVTRPLKFGAPDVLKTIDTAIIRGNFATGHVKTALYGSRDLINWHLVRSSVSHSLRGFHGTPYKYFRLACVANLDKGETIFGATFQFTPRLTNKLR